MIDAGENQTVNCPHCGAPNAAALPACLLCGTALPGAAGATLPGAGPASPPRELAPPGPPAPDPRYASGPPPVYPAYPFPPGAPAPPARAARGGLWLGLGLGLIAGVCLLGLVAGGALLALRNSNLLVAPTATPLDPAALLDQANAAEGQQKGMHYVMTGDFSQAPGGQVPSQVLLEGDVAPPDSYTLHSDQYGDTIVIGADTYVKALGSTTWSRSQQPPGQSNPVSNPTVLLSFLKYYNPESTALQDDVISGTQRLQQVRFEVDLAKMAATEGQDSPAAILLGSDVQGTVQIDAATHLIARLTLLIATPNSGTATLTLQLSRYGVPVTITPPPGLIQ